METSAFREETDLQNWQLRYRKRSTGATFQMVGSRANERVVATGPAGDRCHIRRVAPTAVPEEFARQNPRVDSTCSGRLPGFPGCCRAELLRWAPFPESYWKPRSPAESRPPADWYRHA